jgi:hypothetical protein
MVTAVKRPFRLLASERLQLRTISRNTSDLRSSL